MRMQVCMDGYGLLFYYKNQPLNTQICRRKNQTKLITDMKVGGGKIENPNLRYATFKHGNSWQQQPLLDRN